MIFAPCALEDNVVTDGCAYISLSLPAAFSLSNSTRKMARASVFLTIFLLGATGVLFEGAKANPLVFCAFSGRAFLTPFAPASATSVTSPGWKLLLGNPSVVLNAWVASGVNTITNVSRSVSLVERQTIAMISF